MHARPIARARAFISPRSAATVRGRALGERDRGVVAGRQQQPVEHRLDADPLARGRTGRRPSPGSAAPRVVMRTFAPGGTRRATSSAVIIFVSEAIGSTRVGSRRHSTRPVSRSNSRPERGGRLKCSRTRSRGSSSRTASGDGAVPPPASGAGRRSRSAAPRRGRGRRGRLGSCSARASARRRARRRAATSTATQRAASAAARVAARPGRPAYGHQRLCPSAPKIPKTNRASTISESTDEHVGPALEQHEQRQEREHGVNTSATPAIDGAHHAPAHGGVLLRRRLRCPRTA